MKNININRYPDPDAKKLRKAYADLINVDMDKLIATSGSDEGITIISATFVDKDDVVMSCDPTFSMYGQAAILAKGKYIGIESDKEDFTPDIDTLIKRANEENAKIIYICTPNNPTGYLYSKDDIKKVIDNTSAMVVIDEAYIHFAEGENLDLLDYSNRVIILRTLSKAFSGAGLRVGFIIANKEVIDFLYAAKAPYNLSVTSQTAGEVLVENHKYIEDEIEVIKDASAAVFGMKGANGAILIMTKRGEITRPELVRNVVRVSPLGYQRLKRFYPICYDTEEKQSSVSEDNRSTLYWNPCVPITDNGEASFDFYTSDSDTPYTILVQGVSEDGRIISLKRKIFRTVTR